MMNSTRLSKTCSTSDGFILWLELNCCTREDWISSPSPLETLAELGSVCRSQKYGNLLL